MEVSNSMALAERGSDVRFESTSDVGNVVCVGVRSSSGFVTQDVLEFLLLGHVDFGAEVVSHGDGLRFDLVVGLFVVEVEEDFETNILRCGIAWKKAMRVLLLLYINVGKAPSFLHWPKPSQLVKQVREALMSFLLGSMIRLIQPGLSCLDEVKTILVRVAQGMPIPCGCLVSLPAQACHFEGTNYFPLGMNQGLNSARLMSYVNIGRV
jgi:hypothetical protein